MWAGYRDSYSSWCCQHWVNPSGTSAAVGPFGSSVSVTSPVTSAPVDPSGQWLHFGLWNARSVTNKLNFFQSLVLNTSFDIFAVTETWLTPQIFDREILPFGYFIYRHNRGSRGGGVLVAISNLIPSNRVQLQSSCELLVIHLKLHKDTFVCCTYFPPSSPVLYFTDLAHCLQSLPNSSHFILLGDFNITNVDWSTLHAHSPSSSIFCDLLLLLNLMQLVKVPTHSLGTTLDLVLSNYSDLISDLCVRPTCGNVSDHYLITFQLRNIHISSTTSPPCFMRNYSKANCDHFFIFFLFLVF